MLRVLARKEDPGKEHVRTAETLFIYFLFEFLEGKEVFFFCIRSRAGTHLHIELHEMCLCAMCARSLHVWQVEYR